MIIHRSSNHLREIYYDEKEFTIGFLCPSYHGFLELMEKYFLESLERQFNKKLQSSEELK